MTARVSMGIFRPTKSNDSSGPQAALVTLTVVAGAVFTEARCAGARHDGRLCNRKLMVIPGHVTIEVRMTTVTYGSGRGRVVSCKCGGLAEVIEHR